MSPNYDFTCGSGHTSEHAVERAVMSVRCRCGRVARREIAVARLGGLVDVPMRERGVPLNRMVEAHETILHEAARAGVEPPDTLAMAKAQAKAIQRHRPDLVTGGR